MKINFFEEFPTKENLKKLNLVTFPSTVFIAARSIKDFDGIKKKIRNKKITLGYWPILKHHEGYWLSPFSSPKAVKRTINEIKSYKFPLKIMWDAELPFRHPWLFLRIDHFIQNIPRIRKFFIKMKYEKNRQIYTSEYPVRNKLMELLFRFLGVFFSPKRYDNYKIIMYYTSMHKLVSKLFLSNIRKIQQNYKSKVQVGLGTIATGILGNEPILNYKNLKRDMKEMKRIGIKEVVIFRLGGLNKEYLKVIKRFI